VHSWTAQVRQQSKSQLRRREGVETKRKSDNNNNNNNNNKMSIAQRHINWSSNSKHFFILSDAGKPIFARYGEEDVKLIPLMGIISLLMARTNDSMRTIVAGRYRVVFLPRSPVYLLVVSRTGETVAHLRRQLKYLYHQMLFVVTARGFAVLKKNASYDMRGVLQGIRQPLLSLIHTANSTSSLLLEAVPTLPLPPTVRTATQAIIRAEKCPELAYAGTYYITNNNNNNKNRLLIFFRLSSLRFIIFLLLSLYLVVF
jgi:hypothetical protein